MGVKLLDYFISITLYLSSFKNKNGGNKWAYNVRGKNGVLVITINRPDKQRIE